MKTIILFLMFISLQAHSDVVKEIIQVSPTKPNMSLLNLHIQKLKEYGTLDRLSRWVNKNDIHGSYSINIVGYRGYSRLISPRHWEKINHTIDSMCDVEQDVIEAEVNAYVDSADENTTLNTPAYSGFNFDNINLQAAQAERDGLENIYNNYVINNALDTDLVEYVLDAVEYSTYYENDPDDFCPQIKVNGVWVDDNACMPDAIAVNNYNHVRDNQITGEQAVANGQARYKAADMLANFREFVMPICFNYEANVKISGYIDIPEVILKVKSKVKADYSFSLSKTWHYVHKREVINVKNRMDREDMESNH